MAVDPYPDIIGIQMKRNGLTKGSCQVKKINKSDQNSDWPDPTYPRPYHFFLETC